MTSLSYDAAFERAPIAVTHNSSKDPLISAHEKCFYWPYLAVHPSAQNLFGFPVWGFLSQAGWSARWVFEGSAQKRDNSIRCLQILART